MLFLNIDSRMIATSLATGTGLLCEQDIATSSQHTDWTSNVYPPRFLANNRTNNVVIPASRRKNIDCDESQKMLDYHSWFSAFFHALEEEPRFKQQSESVDLIRLFIDKLLLCKLKKDETNASILNQEANNNNNDNNNDNNKQQQPEQQQQHQQQQPPPPPPQQQQNLQSNASISNQEANDKENAPILVNARDKFIAEMHAEMQLYGQKYSGPELRMKVLEAMKDKNLVNEAMKSVQGKYNKTSPSNAQIFGAKPSTYHRLWILNDPITARNILLPESDAQTTILVSSFSSSILAHAKSAQEFLRDLGRRASGLEAPGLQSGNGNRSNDTGAKLSASGLEAPINGNNHNGGRGRGRGKERNRGNQGNGRGRGGKSRLTATTHIAGGNRGRAGGRNRGRTRGRTRGRGGSGSGARLGAAANRNIGGGIVGGRISSGVGAGLIRDATNTPNLNRLNNNPSSGFASQLNSEANANTNVFRAMQINFNTTSITDAGLYFNAGLPPVDTKINLGEACFGELRENIEGMEEKIRNKYLVKGKAPNRLYSFGVKQFQIPILSGC